MELKGELDRKVSFYKELCFSLNTKKAYTVHRKTYIAFCNSIGANPVPATTQLLCRYAAFLARKLKYTSIKQYFNIIRLLHSEWGLPNPCQDNFHLKATLQGIRRHLGDTVIRKCPITPDLLLEILDKLNVRTPKGASIWAACLLMFFGLLRRSNVMVNSKADFDPAKHLRRQDLNFTKDGLQVTIRWTKTVQYRERVLTIPYPWKKGEKLCPTQGVYQAVRLTPQASALGPALVCDLSPNPTPLTTGVFMDTLRACLSRPGRDTNQYAGHSFRRGGASWAFQKGVSIELVRQLGDWSSNAYTKYVLPTPTGLANATRTMLEGISN